MRRALRYFLLTVVALVVVAVLALATPPGRGIVVGVLERAAAGSGLSVSISGASGWPPFSLGADRIVIADADGPFAEIDNLAVNIKTTALLAGRLAFDAISAERIAVARRPHLPGGGSGGAALPFAADAVSVSRLELGADIAGRPAVVALTGAVTSGAGGRLVARVSANRIDGRMGTLTATIDRANADAPFAADVDLAEDADGILVGLIGRANGPGYKLAAETSVDGAALSGTVALSSSGAARFAGKFTLAPSADGGEHIVASGDGNLAELVPAEYADLLSGPITLAVDADWAAASGGALPRIAVRQGELSTANVSAAISGTLSDAVADLALKINAAKPDGSALLVPLTNPPSRVASVAITGTAAPSGETIRLELVGRIAGLETGTVTLPGVGLSLALETRKDAPLAGGKLPFAARVEADAVETATGRIESVGGAPIILTADGTFDTTSAVADANARLSIAGGNSTFAGTLSAGGMKGSASAEFANLTALSPLAGRPLTGGIAVNAEGTFIGQPAAFKVAATGRDLDIGEATLKRLLAGETHISASLGSGEGGGFSVADLSVASAALTATGDLALTGGTIVGTLKGGVSDLALIADASSGPATFTASVQGAVARPTIDATVNIPAGRLLNQPVENAVVHLAGSPADAGWLAALTLSGGFAGKPLSGKASAALDAAGHLAFPDVDFTIGDNRITGAVERTAAGPLSGNLAVTAPNLQTLGALALVNATGSGEARIAFAPDGERQSLAISFSADGVAYQNLGAQSVSGEVHVDDAFGAPLVRGNATATGATVGGVRLDRAEVTATVEGAATRFAATARGPDIDLSGSGALGGAAGAQVVRLDTLKGRAFALPVALNAPVTINLSGARSAISGAVLALGGGTIKVDGVVAPTLNLVLVANNVAASVANGFAPQLGAEGTITGQAAITGTAAAPAIAWQANWEGLRVTATRNAGLPGLALAARGNATAKATNLTATLSGAGLSLDITGTVPFSGPGLSVTATGTAPLALLALESNRELRLAGSARVNLALSGSLASVATSGTVDLADATVADTNTGFGIAGATGRIAFDGQRATIQQLSGRLAQGGNIVVAGSVAIAGVGLPADLTVRVTNGRYADGDIVNAAFSADLAIKGPLLAGGVVSGRIDLGRTEIQLPDRLAGSATAIDVQHVNAPKGFRPPKARETASGGGPAAGNGGLRLDIVLTGNSGVFVRGFGIDSELGGSLRLTGTTGNPDTVGSLKMQRGRIEALGKRFDFQRGDLTFSGGLIPYVDFAALSQTTGATVTLHVTGPANSPEISFTSSPEMPEEDILSRLLFDRTVGNLSPLQAAQLVDAVAQLTGAARGGGLFARVREATGLDDLDVRQSASGGTTVGVAKRINDNVRVGVEAGTDSAAGRVIIDLDLTKNLKARGEAGQDGTGKVGLTYEREY